MVQTSELKGKVAENPKLLGALWALTLLVVEIGSVVASGGARSGP